MTTALYLLRRYWVHIAVVAALSWGAMAFHGWAKQSGWDERDVEYQSHLLADVRAELEAQVAARTTERESAEAIAEIAAQYEADRRANETAAARLAADLLAGNERLRDHWQGCIATGRVSGDATAARIADGLAQLRREGAVDLVRLADAADARERAWRAYAEEVSGQ